MAGGGQSFDAIVIGSGFGGAVTACRLAESGRRVLVLERGQQRTRDQFPRLGKAGIPEWLWSSRWNGFFDLRVFSRIATLTSSGVGGGSHAYANVHIRAPQQSFREGWPAGFSPETLAPYYERVERMLGVRSLPEGLNLAKTRAYRAAAQSRGAAVVAPNLAVYFKDGPAEAVTAQPPIYSRDPFGLGVNVLQAPCRYCGECDIGCRYNAKNTLDLNYLAIATQRHDAVIRPLSEVIALRPDRDGYRVFFIDRTHFGRASVWAPLVVIAAGTVNTVELLLRCRDEFGLLPKLSPALGQRFSGNGDFLCAALNTRERLDPWNGPVITTALPYVDGDLVFYLQEGGFPPDLAFIVASMRPSGEFLGKLVRGPISQVARLRWFYEEIARLAHDNEALARQVPVNSMIFLGMGRDASDGRITLQRRLGRRPKLEIEWNHARSRPLLSRMESEFRGIAEALGGQYVHNPLWSLLGRLITVHPLGGCALADDPAQGVLDPAGQVWGYPNLYVADGSAIPRAIGPNPSLTISAVAERITERIVAA